MTSDDAVDLPATADPAPLDRSEELIDEAKGAARPALAETADDPGAGTDYPVPGQDDDPAERA